MTFSQDVWPNDFWLNDVIWQFYTNQNSLNKLMFLKHSLENCKICSVFPICVSFLSNLRACEIKTFFWKNFTPKKFKNIMENVLPSWLLAEMGRNGQKLAEIGSDFLIIWSLPVSVAGFEPLILRQWVGGTTQICQQPWKL